MQSMDTVAVICAMESEAVHLRERLDNPQETQLSVWRRTRGTLGEYSVEVIVSGIGLINAAAATAVRLSSPEQRPRAIFNYGCSGAHRQDINPGDVVIGNRTVHTSSLIILPDGASRRLLFWSDDGATSETETLAVDPTLVELAERMGKRTPLPVWPGLMQPPRIHTGAIASADVWTQHGETILALHDEYGSLCEEMEAAAIAQVCAKYGVPFLPVKDISNNELLEKTTHTAAGAITLDDVRSQLGLRAALVVEATIGGMARGE
jgi:adenosylhomocysteine nucleosidase